MVYIRSTLKIGSLSIFVNTQTALLFKPRVARYILPENRGGRGMGNVEGREGDGEWSFDTHIRTVVDSIVFSCS